jgi:sugar-specific transcriptional regulator TrmB
MNLEEIGLNSYEVAVYKALIHLGKSSASEISKQSNVPYGRIYDVLASLEEKGLVLVVPEQTKKFVAAPPAALKELFDHKRELFEQKSKELEAEIQALKPLYTSREKSIVQIVEGKRNFYKLLRQIPDSEKCHLCIKYSSEFQPEWVRETKEYKKKGIENLNLVRYDKETKANVQKWLTIMPDIRALPNDGVAAVISDDKTVLLTLIKNNVSILIKDEAFAKLFAKMFRETYKNAKKIS